MNNLQHKIIKYKNQYIQLFLIIIILQTLLQIFCYDFDSNSKEKNTLLQKIVYDFTNTCSVHTKIPFLQNISKSVKGEGYVVGMTYEENEKYRKTCLTTTYNLIHFALYMFLGYLFPFFWPELVVMGVSYEIWEYYAYKCHDYSDIFYNVSGLFIGYKLANWK